MQWNQTHPVVKAASCLAAALLISTSAFAADAPLLVDVHKAKGLECASCHGQTNPPQKLESDTCRNCHSDEADLIKRTSKAQPNPHNGPHRAPDEKLVCNDCHSIHQRSEVMCQECHRAFKFNVK